LIITTARNHEQHIYNVKDIKKKNYEIKRAINPLI